MARMMIKLAHDLRDEALRVSKEREDEFLKSLSRQQLLNELSWIWYMISSCEQTAVDARAHRREAPQKTEKG